MADIAGLVTGLAICPDVVTPVADRQMLNLTIANLVGIPAAARRAGNNLLEVQLAQLIFHKEQVCTCGQLEV